MKVNLFTTCDSKDLDSLNYAIDELRHNEKQLEVYRNKLLCKSQPTYSPKGHPIKCELTKGHKGKHTDGNRKWTS